jgi:hypothetical protein
MSEVFTFVDASHLISKANLWEERDEARRQRYEKLNNESLPKVAYDKQASENALFKLVFCAIKQITAKWSQPLLNWALTISQLDIYFPNRLNFKA